MRTLPSQCHFFFFNPWHYEKSTSYNMDFFFFLTESREEAAAEGEEESECQRSQVRKVGEKKFQSTNLAVFAEVCPHAGAVPSSHQHMVDEEVRARYAADELARNAIIVVA